MRKREKKGPLSVHAIAGSYVVLLGIDIEEEQSKGVLGFGIERTDHTNNDKRDWLAGFKVFPGVKVKEGALVSTKDHPLQGFFWADFTPRLAGKYTYRVVAMRGTPKKLEQAEDVEVRVDLEDVNVGTHSIYFNRGVAGSQAYARQFKNKKPDKVPDNRAWKWLSRGLEEAIISFIEQAQGEGFGLRASIYEFQHAPVLEAFKAASQRGVDVKIVYDGRANSQNTPNEENRKAIEACGIEAITKPREADKNSISHNKFIVLLQDGKPQQVWTGSTNITRGGIFGHSNVGHQVRDAKVAARYYQYWRQLSQDPIAKDIRAWNDTKTPVPKTLPSPNSTTAIFSPRGSLEALEWYTDRMDKAPGAVFFTAAFGVNDMFAKILRKRKDYLRYVLLESEAKDMDSLNKQKLNRVAVAGVLKDEGFEGWLKEQPVPDLNSHVKYIHTKYMLIDPLGDDPLVISGSANFSNASTKNNDENMLVIRNDKRVADIYLGEFMRLFNHFYFRYIASKFKEADEQTGKKGFLATDDTWRNPYYTKDSPKWAERKYFA